MTDQLAFKTEPDPPAEYQALVGRAFKEIGPNGLGNRDYIVKEIVYKPAHRHGPWLAKTYPYSWNSPYRGPRYRKPALFLDPEIYEEVPDASS